MNAAEYIQGFRLYPEGYRLTGLESPDFVAGWFDSANDHLIP